MGIIQYSFSDRAIAYTWNTYITIVKKNMPKDIN